MTQTLRRDRDLALSRLKYEMAAYRVRLSMLALDAALSAPEEKFNPNHDPANGRFTSGSSGGGGGGGGATQSPSSAAGLRNRTLTVAPSYMRSSEKVKIGANIQGQVEDIGADFKRQTGLTMVVNSGYRSPEGQAQAMYDKLQAGGNFRLYKNKAAAAEILAAYEAAKAIGAGREAIVASMRAVIQHQVERGVYISSHLTNRAIDIAIRDSNHKALTHENLNALFLSIHKHGGRILDEHEPPHIHVQF